MLPSINKDREIEKGKYINELKRIELENRQ